MFKSLAAWCLIALSLVWLGCRPLDFVPLVTAKATESEEFRTSASPTIVVETFNGSIDISDADADEVVVEVTKFAGGFDRDAAEENLEQVQVSIDQKDDTIKVLARRVGNNSNHLGASVVISAPKNAKLKLRSSNGQIVSEGMRGGVEATTSNARLAVVGASGSIDVTTSNGPIEIEAYQARVDAQTSNARVRFEGSLVGGEQRFHTSNGGIDLKLPEGSQFRFEGATSNARIRCHFPIEIEGKSRRTRMKGIVGKEPTFDLTATTSNGGIEVSPEKPEKR